MKRKAFFLLIIIYKELKRINNDFVAFFFFLLHLYYRNHICMHIFFYHCILNEFTILNGSSADKSTRYLISEFQVWRVEKWRETRS
jgi:hypothetical protein